MDSMKYMICKHFSDYDINKINSQPLSWLVTVWEHMNSEGLAAEKKQMSSSGDVGEMVARANRR